MITGKEAHVIQQIAETLRAVHAVHTGATLPPRPDREPVWTADRFNTKKG